jgi:hypothetical protein
MKIATHSMMRDVYQPYLIEWLDHHRSIGIDHFFIYDNDSIVPISESIKDVLFNSDITIELIHGRTSLPDLNVQEESFTKFLSAIQESKLPHYDRVAFIDEDEFIICENNDIKETLKNYISYPALALSWLMFGSSGLINQTPEPQMKKFIKRSTRYYEPNTIIKSIVNPYLVKDIINPHAFSYHFGNCVNVNKVPIEGYYAPPVHQIAWVNHYWVRSREEWLIKLAKGNAWFNKDREQIQFDDLEANCIESIA